jgi:hypothetical protein
MSEEKLISEQIIEWWKDYSCGWEDACEDCIQLIEERQKKCSEELYWAGLEEAKGIIKRQKGEEK